MRDGRKDHKGGKLEGHVSAMGSGLVTFVGVLCVALKPVSVAVWRFWEIFGANTTQYICTKSSQQSWAGY